MKHSVSCLIILGVRISDETLLLVFDILVLGVWISDETLLLVFDIQWNPVNTTTNGP